MSMAGAHLELLVLGVGVKPLPHVAVDVPLRREHVEARAIERVPRLPGTHVEHLHAASHLDVFAPAVLATQRPVAAGETPQRLRRQHVAAAAAEVALWAQTACNGRCWDKHRLSKHPNRLGANTRHLHACFVMNASNVDSYWKRYVDSNRQLEHKCLLVNELIGIRDSVAIEDISHTHCRELIEFLCTCEWAYTCNNIYDSCLILVWVNFFIFLICVVIAIIMWRIKFTYLLTYYRYTFGCLCNSTPMKQPYLNRFTGTCNRPLLFMCNTTALK